MMKHIRAVLIAVIVVLIGYCLYLHYTIRNLEFIQSHQERVFLETTDSLQYYREKYNPAYQN